MAIMCISTMHRFLCDCVLAKEGTCLMRYEELRVEGRFVQRRSRQNKPLFIETVELAGGVSVPKFRGCSRRSCWD